MNDILFHILLYVALALLGVLALAVAVILLISVFLILFMLLQLVGIAPRVPLGYNFRNLVVRWRTTALTVFAFIAVIGLMTVMRAFVNGMYVMTKGSAIAGNVIVLADGSTDELYSELGYGDIGSLATQDCVKKETVRYPDREAETPLVSWELYQVVNQAIPNAKPGGRQRRFVQVRGIEDPIVSGKVHELTLHDDGHWFDEGAGIQSVPGGGTEQYIQGVLGEGLARELGHDFGKSTLAVGDTFDLGPRRWVVVGIMNSSGKTFDSEAWAKRKVVGEMLRKDTRSSAVLRVKDGLDAAQVAEDLTVQFKSPAIVARSEADYFESLNSMNAVFLMAIRAVALFMGIGGIFGIMNTMFAAVSQRARDISVLRILGFARWQILVSFFLESLLLAILGGAIGCALGSLANGWSSTAQLSGGGGGGKSVMLKLVVDASVLAEALGFALIMGCIGGLLPALSAIRLRVLDSLR